MCAVVEIDIGHFPTKIDICLSIFGFGRTLFKKFNESSVLNAVHLTGFNFRGCYCLNKFHKCLIKSLLFGHCFLAYFTAYFKHCVYNCSVCNYVCSMCNYMYGVCHFICVCGLGTQ